MKKILFIATIAFLTSCAPQRMYYWGSKPSSDKGTSRYEELAYQNYDKQSPESVCELICLYEDMVSHPGGTRKVVPPGICAEYGFLLLQESTAETFEKHASRKQKKIFSSTEYSALFPEKGEEMLKKEMELYPESVKFLTPIIKQLTGK